MQLAGADPVEVHHRYNRADDQRKLHQAIAQQLRIDHRCVGNPKVDHTGADLSDTQGRSDWLVADVDTIGFLVRLGPSRQYWEGEGGTRAKYLLRRRRIYCVEAKQAKHP